MQGVHLITEEAARILIVLIVVDYAIAVLGAIRQKRFSSELGVRGLTQKLAIIVLIFAALFLKQTIFNSGLIDLLALQGLIYGLVLNEIASIRRNLKIIGLDNVLLRWIPEDISHSRKESSEQEQGKEERRP